MSAALFLLLATSCLSAAGALWLWQSARWRSQRQVARQRLQILRPIQAARAARMPAPAAEQALAWDWIRRCGLRPSLRALLMVLVPAPALSLAVALRAGWVFGVVALALLSLGTLITLQVIRARRLERLTRGLPGFVDLLVRAMMVGHAPAAAFTAAVEGTDDPLGAVMREVEVRTSAGMELEAALAQAGRTHGFEELNLLASVMRMSTVYGGRVDQVLQRTSAFLRDRQQAQEELLALSAETRMSAWVLGLLPALVVVLILLSNSEYLAGMWRDSDGQKMLLGAFGLQVLGGAWLYRLARL